MSYPTLVLFAKYPIPGMVKTRLVRALRADGAAALHRRLAKQVFDLLIASGAPVEVQMDMGDEQLYRAWLPDAQYYVEQAYGDLTERLMAAMRGGGHIFFGADTPDLTLDIVRQAIAALDTHEVVIGPAEDGGYYLIGMRKPMPWLFTDMMWSTHRVLPMTLERLAARRIEPYLLPLLADCDVPEDLPRWPQLTAGL